MFDYNFEVNDGDEINMSFKFLLKDGKLTIGFFGDEQNVRIDPKEVKKSIEKHSGKKKYAYWTQGGSQLFHSENAKWEDFECRAARGKGIVFGIKNGGCEESMGPEDWSLILQEKVEKNGDLKMRLKIHAAVICCCDDEYTECDTLDMYAEPVKE